MLQQGETTRMRVHGASVRRAPLRIALLQARHPDAAARGDPGAPVLGLLALAAWTRAKLPGAAEFIYLDTYYVDDAGIASELRRYQPDLVAISGFTVWAATIARLAALARASTRSDTWIVVGGPHASSYPEDCLNLADVDGVVSGEGEIPFADIVEHLLGRRPHAQIRGLARRVAGVTRNGPPAPPPDDMDEVPPPAWDLCDFSKIDAAPGVNSPLILPPHRYRQLMTSRGCPYHCGFCHSIFGHKFRGQSAERVLDEIEHYYREDGIRHFEILDDIFNGNYKRSMEICHGVQRRKLDVKLYTGNSPRMDTVDRPLLRAMKEAGFVYIAAAFESTSTRVLSQLLHKTTDIEKTLENVAIADEEGIFVKGLFMIGVPGETEEEIQLTIRTAETSRLHHILYSVLNPYPGTTVGEELHACGVDVSAAQMDGFRTNRNFAGLSERRLNELVREAYRRFWTPARVIGFIGRHPHPESVLPGLLNPAVRGPAWRTFREVFGFPEDRASTPAAFAVPAPVDPRVVAAAQWTGRAGQRAAAALWNRLPRGPAVHPDVRGRVGTRRKPGAPD